MKILTIKWVVLLAILASASFESWAQIEAVNLRCEYLRSPIGLDVASPRLSWELQSSTRAQRQSAYQVLVATSAGILDQGKGDLWDSGKVESPEQSQIVYGGTPLVSHQVCFWRVRVWNQDGVESGWSKPAQWAMGVLRPEEWTGKWITSQLDGSGPLPLFRKEFAVEGRIRRAVVYLCGLGFHELYLNGNRVGDSVFAPDWTNYKKTCVYSSYEVTTLLQKGANAVGVMLGNGMYNVKGGRYVKFKGSFGPPSLTAILHLEYEDGTTHDVVTDSSWKTSPGPVVFSCIYGGEDYDAREVKPGWTMPQYGDSSWVPAVESQGPGGRLTSEGSLPIKVMRVRDAVGVTQPKPGIYVYDLGQNTSGRPILRVKGPRGSTVKLIPGELLDGDGLVTQRSSGGPVWFSYTLAGKGIEEWRPQFSYYGFRYVQVEGATPEKMAERRSKGPIVLDLKGDFTYAAAEIAGEFSCSNETVNRIHELILTAIRSNFQSVLTDCPHREKLGWLEVSHLLAGAIMYNYDVPRFYAKVSRDMRDSQRENGLVPDIAPEYTVFNGGFVDSPEWGSASILNPWYTYLTYGDRRVLEVNYVTMQRYVDYLATTAQDNIVSHGLGDWYDIGPKSPGESQLTSKGLTATAVYYQDLSVMAKVATVLGKPDDAKRFAERAVLVRDAFNRQFHKANPGDYDQGSQTASAMPFVVGLVPEADRAAVLEGLVDRIKSGGYHVTAGDVGFSYLVRTLTDNGAGDTLYKMVVQDEGPGYVDQLNKNATSLTEAWDANPASSNNHCMLGHAEEWFYRGLGGIRSDELSPGYRHFVLSPDVPDGLDWVRVKHATIRGPIVSEWRAKDHTFTWTIEIPPNTTATVCVPSKSSESVLESQVPAKSAHGVDFLGHENGRSTYLVHSGSYQFEAQLTD